MREWFSLDARSYIRWLEYMLGKDNWLGTAGTWQATGGNLVYGIPKQERLLQYDGPVEPQFHLAIKTFTAQNQQNRQNQQMSRKESAEKSHSTSADSTSADFCTRYSPPGCSIPDVMTLVCGCGAACGSNEHFIATELFVKREQREMFLTISTAKDRLEWLRRKYNAKYGH